MASHISQAPKHHHLLGTGSCHTGSVEAASKKMSERVEGIARRQERAPRRGFAGTNGTGGFGMLLGATVLVGAKGIATNGARMLIYRGSIGSCSLLEATTTGRPSWRGIKRHLLRIWLEVEALGN